MNRWPTILRARFVIDGELVLDVCECMCLWFCMV